MIVIFSPLIFVWIMIEKRKNEKYSENNKKVIPEG
jgi:hypothetical protein